MQSLPKYIASESWPIVSEERASSISSASDLYELVSPVMDHIKENYPNKICAEKKRPPKNIKHGDNFLLVRESSKE